MNSIQKSISWALIIRGLLFILFGLFAIFFPTGSLYNEILYFGVLFLITGGLYAVISILLRKNNKQWYLGIVWALIDFFLGGYMIFRIELATEIFTNLIGGFALLMGVASIVTSFFIRSFKIFLYINAVISLLFGSVILFNPFPATFLPFIIGLYALLFGMFVSYLGIATRRLGKTNPKEIPSDEINA